MAICRALRQDELDLVLRETQPDRGILVGLSAREVALVEFGRFLGSHFGKLTADEVFDLGTMQGPFEAHCMCTPRRYAPRPEKWISEVEKSDSVCVELEEIRHVAFDRLTWSARIGTCGRCAKVFFAYSYEANSHVPSRVLRQRFR